MSDDTYKFRNYLVEKPFNIAENNKSIFSLSFVGSFSKSRTLEGLSDIDVVIIVDYLTEWLFKEICQSFSNLEEEIKSNFGFDLYVNSTFGPLKFNKPGMVVYHVMIYDIAGHISHCRKSPFTCYDWQKTDLYAKKHMSEIYSVECLMPSFFLSSRRGVKDYLGDFEKSIVSYRSYSFRDGEVFEDIHENRMTTRDKYEFAYHILRFLTLNFLKMYHGNNFDLNDSELVVKFLSIFPQFNNEFSTWFGKLRKYKTSNSFPLETKDLEVYMRAFMEKFAEEFQKLFPEQDKQIIFLRHAKTELNKEAIFLGQKLNPKLLESDIPQLDMGIDKVYSSPSRRSIDTATLLVLDWKKTLCVTPFLYEIDYGNVEGKDYTWLKSNYPDIVNKWNIGEDPRFPNGESQEDVRGRVSAFLDELQRDQANQGNILVVTHNVWLRVLLGFYLKISRKDWYKLNIPHNTPLKFRRIDKNRIIPDFDEDTLRTVLKNISVEKFITLQKTTDVAFEERIRFWENIYKKRELLFDNCHRETSGAILVPMAGEGSRFKDYGFETSKPLIKVDNKEMIARTMACLPRSKRIVYLVRSHLINADLEKTLNNTSKRVYVVPVDELTEGQASTCLLGMDYVKEDEPLLIAPCDNGMIWDDEKFNEITEKADVVCWTFSKHLSIKESPQSWGYIKCDKDKNILGVSVKVPITSNPYEEQCIIGTFWFKTAKLFKDLASELIEKDIRVNGEFYVDSIITLAIERNLKVKCFEVDNYISWGKPKDLFEYQKWSRLTKLLN